MQNFCKVNPVPKFNYKGYLSKDRFAITKYLFIVSFFHLVNLDMLASEKPLQMQEDTVKSVDAISVLYGKIVQLLPPKDSISACI